MNRFAFRRVHAPLRACAFAWCALSWSSRALRCQQRLRAPAARARVRGGARSGGDVDAFGATTLAPAVSSDAAAVSAPYASPSLADTDIASRSLVETYPRVMLSVDDPARAPPAIGSWAAPPPPTRLRRGKPPSRAKYSATSTATGAATSTRDPASQRRLPLSPRPPSPRWPTSTLGSTKLPAEAATRVRCVTGPVIWDYDQTKVRYPREPPGFFEVDPGARDSEGQKDPAQRPRNFPARAAGSVRAFLERHREHLRHHRGRVPVFVLMGETTRVLRSDPALRPEFLGRGVFSASVQGKQMLRFRPDWTARRENRWTRGSARSRACARVTRRATVC